jgi:hypothetical protein
MASVISADHWFAGFQGAGLAAEISLAYGNFSADFLNERAVKIKKEYRHQKDQQHGPEVNQANADFRGEGIRLQ